MAEGGEQPKPRGWLDCALHKEGENYVEIVFFGGLTGDDVNPVRMNDIWYLTIERD